MKCEMIKYFLELKKKNQIMFLTSRPSPKIAEIEQTLQIEFRKSYL